MNHECKKKYCIEILLNGSTLLNEPSQGANFTYFRSCSAKNSTADQLLTVLLETQGISFFFAQLLTFVMMIKSQMLYFLQILF